ncbi:MAG: MFS transporter [bacterium]
MKNIWHNKSFVFYLIGQTISSLGDGFYLIGFMWLAFQLSNGKGIVLGGVFSIYTLSEIVFGFLAGPVVDRVNKKVLLITIDIIRGVIVMILYVLVRFNSIHIAHVYFFTFIFSVFSPFFHRAEFAVIPQLVDSPFLLNVNGILAGSKKLMQVIAPALGGLFIGFFGMASCFLFDAISFFLSVICIMLIAIRTTASLKKNINIKSFMIDIKEGYRFLINSSFLLTLALYAACINFFGAPIFPLLVLISQKANVGSSGYGAMMSGMSVGFIISSFIIVIIGKFLKKIPIVMLGLLISSSGIILMALGNGSVPLVIASVLLGLGINLSNLPIVTLFQENVPQEKIGVVSSFVFTIAQVAMPISMMLSGLLVDLFSLTGIFIGISTILIVGAVIGFFLPTLRNECVYVSGGVPSTANDLQ